MAANYSFYAIPAYWILSLVPHAYAVSTLKKANNNQWDNTNVRSTVASAKYQQSVPAAVWARFERAEAAHKNGLENAPFFIGAVVAGTAAGLSGTFMNTAAGVYLGLRVLYTLQYINTTSLKYSYLRSLTWIISTILLLGIFVKAAGRIAAKS